jgi:hypothetical protein
MEQQNRMMTEKDREIAIIKNRSEQAFSEVEKKNQLLEELKGETGDEKARMVDKIETLNEKLNTVSDELMQKKLDFGRENALKEQQLTFKQQRVDDLQAQMSDISSKYEERLSS